jgi:hypothetical protein
MGSGHVITVGYLHFTLNCLQKVCIFYTKVAHYSHLINSHGYQDVSTVNRRSLKV